MNRLSKAEAIAVRYRYADGKRDFDRQARFYGVQKRTIADCLTGDSWKTLLDPPPPLAHISKHEKKRLFGRSGRRLQKVKVKPRKVERIEDLTPLEVLAPVVPIRERVARGCKIVVDEQERNVTRLFYLVLHKLFTDSRYIGELIAATRIFRYLEKEMQRDGKGLHVTLTRLAELSWVTLQHTEIPLPQGSKKSVTRLFAALTPTGRVAYNLVDEDWAGRALVPGPDRPEEGEESDVEDPETNGVTDEIVGVESEPVEEGDDTETMTLAKEPIPEIKEVKTTEEKLAPRVLSPDEALAAGLQRYIRELEDYLTLYDEDVEKVRAKYETKAQEVRQKMEAELDRVYADQSAAVVELGGQRDETKDKLAQALRVLEGLKKA